MPALTAALKPLRTANQLATDKLYKWQVISETGDPVTAADGLSLKADGSIHNCRELDAVILISREDSLPVLTKSLVRWLLQQAEQGVLLGGVGGGVGLLLMVGLEDTLAGRCASNEPENVDQEPALKLISTEHGARLAGTVRNLLALDRSREASSGHWRTSTGMPIAGEHKPELADVIELMQSNLEEPINPDHLASLVGISRRQMERLFHEYLQSSPSKYYLQLRLEHARELLTRSRRSIADIAAACGFVSTAHFSRCYRNYTGTPPRDERRPVAVRGPCNNITPQRAVALS